MRFDKVVISILLRKHGLPPCDDKYRAENILAQVFRERYERQSEVDRVLEDAFIVAENLLERENLDLPFKIPACGILRLRKLFPDA